MLVLFNVWADSKLANSELNVWLLENSSEEQAEEQPCWAQGALTEAR